MATKDSNNKSGSSSHSSSTGRSQHKSTGTKKSTTSSRSSSSTGSRSTSQQEQVEFPEKVSNVIMAAHQGIDMIERGLKVAKNTLEAIKKMREI